MSAIDRKRRGTTVYDCEESNKVCFLSICIISWTSIIASGVQDCCADEVHLPVKIGAGWERGSGEAVHTRVHVAS